jgi:plastocyanin domain-containing protein
MTKSNNKSRTPMILAWLVAAVVVSVVATVVIVRHGGSAGDAGQTNASIVGGNQTVEITAKNGYSPRDTLAKANLPMTLKIESNGDFDCSSSLSIPKLGYQANLPPSGETVINVPPQQAGSTLKGLCSMGMYSFTIRFE